MKTFVILFIVVDPQGFAVHREELKPAYPTLAACEAGLPSRYEEMRSRAAQIGSTPWAASCLEAHAHD